MNNLSLVTEQQLTAISRRKKTWTVPEIFRDPSWLKSITFKQRWATLLLRSGLWVSGSCVQKRDRKCRTRYNKTPHYLSY